MAIYSINDIEDLTGIKAHTLRTWEKRYGLQISRRTPANVRYYLDEDLKRIVNIAILNKGGMKISHIAKLPWTEIRHLAAEQTEIHHSHETDLDSLSLCLINLDQAKFDKIISINTDQNGFSSTLENLVFPLFEKLNSMYLTGTIKPVHESFLNNMLKGKIMSQIDQLRKDIHSGDPQYVLFQPKQSQEELGAMLLNYYLIESGYLTLNLGNNVDTTDLSDAYEINPAPHIIGLFNAGMEKVDIERYIDHMLEHCGNTQIILSGFDVYRAGIEDQERVKVLPDLTTIVTFLKQREKDAATV